MKPPIFVYGDGGIDVYSTREKAEANLEAVDVRKGIYKAYDSEGYRLEISITSENFVAINPTIPLVNKSDELRELLQDFLKGIKKASVSEDWLAGASLEELTVKALEYKVW